MFACDYYKGFRIFEGLFGEDYWLASLIDKFRGDLPWHIYYRMSMLRVISFNCDKYWSYKNAPVYQVSKSKKL